MFQPHVYAAMMFGDVFCHWAALVCQYQCDQLDERAGVDFRRDLRIVTLSSDIRRGLLDEAPEALAIELGFP